MQAPTLARHLLAWALGALVVVWASLVAMGFRAGQHEADELTDGHLASVAALLVQYRGGAFFDGTPSGPPTDSLELKAHDYQQSMSVVIWDADGRVLTRTGQAPLPPFSRQEGFATLQLGEPALPWRTFSRWDVSHTRKAMVLLSLQERDELAEDIAEQISEPGLWLLPVVALALGLAIRHGLRPLVRLSRDVHALDIHRNDRLKAQPRPQELQAIAEAVDTLVTRYHAALTRERALANEFAHELRTPLASLALQTRALCEASSHAARERAAAQLQADVQRASDVLSHLLALARASRTELHEAAGPVDLDTLARRLVAEYAPLAHGAGRELGLESAAPLVIQGHAVLLEVALRNLLDNALHHTPLGTVIEVRLNSTDRWLEVADHWPASGVSPGDRKGSNDEQALGLGLGHRVVEKIAAIHGGRFQAMVKQGVSHGSQWRLCFPPLDHP